MNEKQWTWWDLLVALLIAAIVVAEMWLTIKIQQVDEDTERVEAIMVEAQKRIDNYLGSLPAQERPAETSAPTEATDAPVVTVIAPGEPETPGWYIEDLPLDKSLQKTAFEAACKNGVDYLLVLAVMSEESEFDSSVVSACGCYGLMQLNPRYFPSGLSDEDNIKAGTAYLGELLSQYKGDVAAALRAYNRGYDDGDRDYSNAVLAAKDEIMDAAEVIFP